MRLLSLIAFFGVAACDPGKVTHFIVVPSARTPEADSVLRVEAAQIAKYFAKKYEMSPRSDAVGPLVHWFVEDSTEKRTFGLNFSAESETGTIDFRIGEA